MSYIFKAKNSSSQTKRKRTRDSNSIQYQQQQQINRLLNSIELKLATAYINGVKIPDFVLKNACRSIISLFYQYYSQGLIPYQWILTESETLAEQPEELMQVQYNLPQKMFSLMLEEEDILYPKYSMALWEKGATNLKQAQLNMLEDMTNKANIQDGDSVLDIGCGWGSAANYILHKFPNTKVTGLNLSHEQCQYIRGKMQAANSYFSSERFTLIEANFNQVNFEDKFDKIISLGVFEHIGNLTKSFAKLNSFLQPEGKVFIHIIATKLPHNIFDPFLNKYIFPRARAWHYEMIPSCDRHLKTVESWFLKGSNYAQTLQAWLKNFDRSQDLIKNLDYGMDFNRFRRMWRLYLLLLIAYFSACGGKFLGNGQYLMVRA